MKRPERLHEMMRYLNNREYFNLQDLMDEYSISKSTALRDIEALEQLGMPIYSEHGRNGGYGILKNSLLSPISFTMDEIYALYFAMLTLEAYEKYPPGSANGMPRGWSWRPAATGFSAATGLKKWKKWRPGRLLPLTSFSPVQRTATVRNKASLMKWKSRRKPRICFIRSITLP